MQGSNDLDKFKGHTPGPWGFDDSENLTAVSGYAAEGALVSGTVLSYEQENYGPWHVAVIIGDLQGSAANAALIAAAPDLLAENVRLREAGTELMTCLDFPDPWDFKHTTRVDRAIEAFRSALQITAKET